jgi:tRNA (adenine37-N6)-methyltransferase
MSSHSPSLTLTLEPIGYLRSVLRSRVDAPRQPAASQGTAGVIELLPGCHYEHALEDLAGWDRIWVIFWFHRNAGWRPKVLPPRNASGRKGVFATRAPHRPNPLGLSTLKLLQVSGLNLHVEGVDLLDDTPVLDIKPYVPYTDAFPDAASGWLEAAQDPVPSWDVSFEPLALEQLSFLLPQMDYDLRTRICTTLQLGPQPHPYRRIKPVRDELQLAVKDWRIDFRVENQQVTVRRLRSGYRETQLNDEGGQSAPDLHREFARRWSHSP